MDLSVYRERINDIDDQMVRLFVERMQVSAEIAGAKAEQNLPVLDLKREQAVLQKVMEKAGEDFEIYARKLYQTLFDVSKSYQA
ncbi:MAG: chorismate mutase, partial [Anaerotignum sp.]|nr:chorismate mutase [Anaerotignum sp.]